MAKAILALGARPQLMSRPMGVLESDAIRLSPQPGDAALVDDLRKQVGCLEIELSDKDAELREALTPTPMRVVKVYKDATTSVADVVAVGAMLELLGFTVGTTWSRDHNRIIDGMVLSVVDDR